MLDLRELDIPVVGAPMAGGPSTPELAAAVSVAGGLGFLAGGYKSAPALAREMTAVRAASSSPFGVNLFVVRPYVVDSRTLEAYRSSLVGEADRLAVELGVPRWDDDHWQDKVDLVLDESPAVVSFTFGCPPAELLRELARRDCLSCVTVTSVDEARQAVARGAASLAVQGPGAGGHRGSWEVDTRPDPLPLLELVTAVVAAVDVPVMAGGGLKDAPDVAGVLELGAVAALTGTAFLLADEAGTNPAHRDALKAAPPRATELTRAYTGRWARGLGNRFMRDHRDAPAGYPQLHHLTAPLRAAAITAHDLQVAHCWSGTGHAQARQAPAAGIVLSLAP